MKNAFIELIQHITALIDVKTILSFALVATCVWGFMNGIVHSEYFTALVSSVITYFFTKAHYEKM